MNKKIIDIKNVSFSYNNGKEILSNINLEIIENDFMGIIGPNGGGKTTFIKLILSLLKPKTGKITYNKDLKIGYLPQNTDFDKNFPINVGKLISSGMVNSKKSKKEIWSRVEELIALLGLEEIQNTHIAEISGGQLQRALIGRAIANNPALLILDEPGTFVDTNFEHEFFEILSEINKNTTILLVSHDLGMITSKVKSIACVNRSLHYHPEPQITAEQLKSYKCPIKLITHGEVPHTVLKNH